MKLGSLITSFFFFKIVSANPGPLHFHTSLNKLVHFFFSLINFLFLKNFRFAKSCKDIMECFHLSFTQFLFPDVVVQSVMSDSWPPHELQHARLPCPSTPPRPFSNLCPLSRWCHPTISSSVAHLSSCPQSFPASWSFPVSWLFTSGDQSIGALASASVLPMNIQGWLWYAW